MLCTQKVEISKVGPRGFGELGKWLFIFRELGSTSNYFQGFVGQAHSFEGIRGSLQKSKKKSYPKGKTFISFDIFLKKSSASGGGGGDPPDPPWKF